MNNKESTTESDNSKQMKVFLPNKLLECLPRTSTLPKERLRWNTNEEIASYLISFDRHEEWLSCTLKTRPLNGSIILYNRKKVKYRKDGYCWKKRKDGKTTREDHMKLKVQGMECLYGCYVHSSIVPTFHRRCYWLLQNPDIVLVHYLNVPSLEDCGKVSRPLLCAVAERRDSLRWSREELLSQLKPMFHSIKWSCGNGSSNGSSDLSIEQLVQHIMESQQTKPQPRTHACLCSTALASPGANIPHRCNSTKHRIISPKLPPHHADGQGLASGSEGGGCREAEGSEAPAGVGGAAGGAVPGKAQTPVTAVRRLGVRSPAAPQDGAGASPCSGADSSSSSSSSSSLSSSSPPKPHQASSLTLGSNGAACNGFYSNQQSLATVTLPQNAVIVMTTAISRAKDGEDAKGERATPASPCLSVAQSSCLVLSPVPPNPDTPPPPSASAPHTPVSAAAAASSCPTSGGPPTPRTACPTPGVATLSLTLLSSPVIGGLLLTDRLLPGADPPASLSLLSPHPPSPSPSPLPVTSGLSPSLSAHSPHTLPPSSPPSGLPSSDTPVAFDPDSFLNSPKQGQTYGGPSHPRSHPSPSPTLSPSSQAPSLALSLSPASPPSSSPPSSLSSFSSEAERGRDMDRESAPLIPTSPHLSFPLSPSQPPSPMPPLCLESSLNLDTLNMLEPVDPARGGSVQLARAGDEDGGRCLEGQPILGQMLSLNPSEVARDPDLSETDLSGPKRTREQWPDDQLLPGLKEEDQEQRQLYLLQYKPQEVLKREVRQEESAQADGPQRLTNQGLKREDPGPQPPVLPKKQILPTGDGRDLGSLVVSFRSSCPGMVRPWVQMKEESAFSSSSSLSTSSSSSSRLSGYEAEETPMDTNHSGDDVESEQEAAVRQSHSVPQGGDGGPLEAGAAAGDAFVISFDSPFPDLISELMAEDGRPAQSGRAASPSPQTQPLSFCFSSPAQAVSLPTATGGRYVVESQALPAPSSLPFPSLSPSAPAGDPDTDLHALATITDFSPEWSYPEGGVKVLITGPWTEAMHRYTCMFDHSTVPASLIQPGVLRCYCPAHGAGLVSLQVLEDTVRVSSSVLFEYRPRSASSLPSSQLDWLSLDDSQFRMFILERLEQMERRMAEMAAGSDQRQQASQRPTTDTEEKAPAPQSGPWFEQRIVAVCESMMARGCWTGGRGDGDGGDRLLHSACYRGMTLLHLAAAQGYVQLIHTLMRWRNVNSDSLDLEQEVDPLNVDHFSCTPLMWACALGHQGAAVLLYHWNSLAVDIPDSLGRLPLAVARSRGHTRLADCLEELIAQWGAAGEGADLGQTTPLPPPPSPLSSSPDTGLSSCSSLASPGDPPSRSPSSAYSSGSAPPSSPLHSPADAMDTTGPSPSGSSPPSSPPGTSPHLRLPLPPWEPTQEPSFLMEYESAGSPPGTPHSKHTDFEAELLGLGEDAENEDYLPAVEDLQVDMVTLAEQIIEATPDHIKQDELPRESPLRERQDNATIPDTMPWLATYLDTADTLPTPSAPRCVRSSPLPLSSRSPRSPQPPSPLGALALQRLRPPNSAAWAEFLGASANRRMEHDFALLTLSDSEQRELYEAARVIQNAFRRYKGRRLKEQQDMAAAIIQRCYRKYKQLTWIALKYALYKKMTQAAILIQSKFRSYYEQKKFQQSRRAAVLIQQYYRSYKGYERLKQAHRGAGPLNAKIRGSFLTKKQDQAARKIMRFLRRCRHRIKELKQNRELERLQKRGLAS